MITIAPELRELPHYQLADLLELQGELKDLTERNAAKLRRSIAKHGIFVPFFVWPAPDGNTYILDGHQRKRTLVKDGHGSLPVPCVLVHADTLPDAKEKLLVISSQYGRITQEGFDEFTFDLPDVGELVHFDALAFEFEQDEEPAGTGDAEPQIDRAAELQEKWGTERGQLWAIGDHRLLCGDSTVRADVERVMGGERAELMVTDPPYGIGHKNDAIPTNNHKTHTGIDNDQRDSKEFVNSFVSSLDWFDGTFYIFGAYVQFSVWYKRLNEWRKVNQVLVWQKDNAVLSRLHYNLKFEVIYHGYDSSGVWNGDNTQDDVIIYRNVNSFGYVKDSGERNSRNDAQIHPHQKPTDMLCGFIELASNSTDVVYDPFAGSGTTLVACQNLNRRGRAIEISPAYCAVILQRMADAFPGIEIHQLP